jgi:hypothetical protein
MSDNVTENPTPAEPAQQPEPQPEPDAPKAEETDWKAMARKWEKLAKENSKAAEERDKLKQSAMTEQEKAVAEAKAAGLSEAAKTYGSKLAAAELKAAASAKGVDLSSISKYLKADMFVGEDGEVDDNAIKAAVADFAKSMPSAKRNGADFDGGNGAGRITREQLASMTPADIAKAQREGRLSHLM